MGLDIFLGHRHLDTSALHINSSNRDDISHVVYVHVDGKDRCRLALVSAVSGTVWG
jgi:hypothetical protein